MMQQPEPGRDQENISGWLVEDPDGGAGRASLGAPSPMHAPPHPSHRADWPTSHATPLGERQPMSADRDAATYASPKSESLDVRCTCHGWLARAPLPPPPPPPRPRDMRTGHRVTCLSGVRPSFQHGPPTLDNDACSGAYWANPGLRADSARHIA